MTEPTLFTPVDPHLHAGDRPRLTRANLRLLDALRESPRTNVELVPVCGLRASARVHDLRQYGYRIDSEPVSNGVWRYTLKGDGDE